MPRIELILKRMKSKVNWTMDEIKELYPAYTGTVEQFCPDIAAYIAYSQDRKRMWKYIDEHPGIETEFQQYDLVINNSLIMPPKLSLEYNISIEPLTQRFVRLWTLSVASWWMSSSTYRSTERSISLTKASPIFATAFQRLARTLPLHDLKCKPDSPMEDVNNHTVIECLLDYTMDDAIMHLKTKYDQLDISLDSDQQYLENLIDVYEKSTNFAQYWNKHAVHQDETSSISLGRLMEEYKSANLLKKFSMRRNSKLVRLPKFRMQIHLPIPEQPELWFLLDTDDITLEYFKSTVAALKVAYAYNTNGLDPEYYLFTSASYLEQFLVNNSEHYQE